MSASNQDQKSNQEASSQESMAGKPEAAQASSQDAAQASSQDAEQQSEQSAVDEDVAKLEQNLDVLLAQAQEQISQYHEQLLRAKAEAENIRRRASEDVAKARKFAIESFAESLVAVRDSLEAALATPDQTPEAWKQGVETTLRQLTAAFDRNSLKEIAPQPGDKFDPHQHQAISSVPSSQPEGTVAQLLQKGYTIAERVLRPALVMVSTGQSAEEQKS